MKSWKRLEPTTVTKVGWRTVVSKRFITSHGVAIDADTTNPEKTQAAGMVALTTDGQVIIARQFRAGPELVMDEIPGGLVDAGEEPEIAARRELREEVGYEAGDVQYLGMVFKDGWNNTRWHYFLATNCTPHPDGQQTDEHEDIEVSFISIDQLLHNAKNAKMTDCEAVLLAYDKLQELKK